MKTQTLEQEVNARAAKPPTIQDVAMALGMHKSTVSVALSGKGTLSSRTRSRIVTAAREMGYEPNPLAQRLATGYDNPMVAILSDNLDLGLGTQKILMIQRELGREPYEVPMYAWADPTGALPQSRASQVRRVCRQRPRAIIAASQMVDEDVASELYTYQQGGGIVVSYDTNMSLDCDQVVFDREDNAYRTAKYLLERGHRRLGLTMATSVDWRVNAPQITHSARLNGFRRALGEYGLTVREDWLFRHSTYEKGGQELARRFIELRDRPTGLCIVNDYVALAFMVEVIRYGVRVPEDVSVVGHDNQPIASYCPVPLTSAVHPVEQIVISVLRLLRNRLAGLDEPPIRVAIPGEIVERASVTPIE